jgi:4-amino-4-deoxy-L-arabinose transferase-like glycosyltransferase
MTTTTHSLELPSTAPKRGQFAQLLSRISPPTLILIGIMLLAALLNFVNISAIGDANTYYTAAVEAMLQSPSNFFFAAAEPGGSVTVDKPPLGLWLQAISAFFLGVNGFAVVLPQILAGIFSVPLLYMLVKRYFGTAAGLIAALVMAIMPVTIAVQRNNTMDATLIFTLLLAAWTFIKATETGKLKWLLAGGVLVGLGFNIKMLQAFLPLPAFYALYFLGSANGWGKKIAHLVVTTVVLLVVSLSWIIVVDLTPADQRPYVGSSDTNSALELAIGYNGLQRLLGGVMGGGGAGRDDGNTTNTTGGDAAFITPGDANGQQFTAPDDATPPTDGTMPNGMTPPTGTEGGAGGGMFGGEIGTASVLRLFTQPLDNEIGWLLPFGLFSLVLVVIASRPRLPLTTAHKGAILWGGWLLTEVVFFSAASFFHAYYLAMLTPPLAALVGIGVMRLWKIHEQRKLLAIALLVASVGATLAFQFVIASGYTDSLLWLVIPVAIFVIGAGALALNFAPISRFSQTTISRLAVAGFASMVIALTFVPTVWAGMGTMSGSNSTLPSAYGGDTSAGRGGQPMMANYTPPTTQDDAAASPDDSTDAETNPFGGRFGDDGGNRGQGMMGGMGGQGVDTALIEYLQANTEGMRYMMAVGSSNQGAEYVLETGRGVLYMGGFSGQDPVVDADDLQALVDAGELRYILSGGGFGGRGGMGGLGGSSDVSTWIEQTCTAVTDLTTTSGTLYDCAVTTTASTEA